MRAAVNRAGREKEKVDRAHGRAFVKIDRDVAQLMAKARSLESKLERDPIKALSLTYSKQNGFQSQPFTIETDLFSGTVQLTDIRTPDQEPPVFEPPALNTVTSSVRPLDVLLTRWATVVALEVTNDDPDFQLRVNWVRKSDRQSSPIFLLDTEGSQYYYPIATTLSGSVVAGHPRIGLVAFEPFRVPTTSVKVHCANVQLQKGRGAKQTFAFSHRDPILSEQINEILMLPRFSDQVAAAFRQQAQKLRRSMTKSQSGCMIVLAGCLIAIGFALALAYVL